MRSLDSLLKRATALFRGARIDTEMDEELRFHLQKQIEANIAAGMTPGDAREAALRAFGGLERMKEECRDARGVRLFDDFLQDLRYGLRQLHRAPGFAFVAVLTIALGVGATTAVFSVVKAVLLNSLPYYDPGRLVALSQAHSRILNPATTSYGTFVEWKARSRSFERIAVYRGWGGILRADGRGELVRGMRVSSGFFSLLGVRPLHGREFAPEEDRPDRWRVIMLSHGFWQQRFGGDPGVVGRNVTLGDRRYLVVGILPPEFRPLLFRPGAEEPEIWAPLGYDISMPDACRTCGHLMSVARLKPGVTIGQAAEEMRAVAQGLVKDYPADYPADSWVLVQRLSERMTGRVERTLWLLFGAVCLLLLIACANVANLLLARGCARAREIAVRAALGAGRGRVVRQLLTESLLLALAGGAAGVGLAAWAGAVLLRMAPTNLPRLDEASMEPGVLLFALAASLAASLVFGIVPALQSSVWRPNSALKEGGRTAGAARSRSRSLVVVGELALAFVLLAGAGLLARSFASVLGVDPGFDANSVATMDLTISGAKYQQRPAIVQFYRRLLEGVQALPGVESAGVVSTLPVGGSWDQSGFHIYDRLIPDPEAPSADTYVVSPGYFQALRIALRRGRYFTADDNEKAPPVALVGETLAREIWPGEDPLGKRIQLGSRDPQAPWHTVVGVVADVRQYGLDHAPTLQAYLPALQTSSRTPTMLVVRGGGDAETVARSVREVLRGIDADQVVTDVKPMTAYLAESLSQRRFTLALLALFAGLALGLAAVGIYGVVSFSVGQRTQEIGVRMALGAQRRQVLALVLRQGAGLALAGLAAGAAGAVAASRLLTGMLYGVRPEDPGTFIAVALVFAAVSLLACLVPARRATRVDPMTALRCE